MDSDVLHTWMTAVFCCLLNFLLTGLFKISGLLFVETQSHFQVSRQSASLPYILSTISRSVAGPIAGFVGYEYGLRIVLVAGCVISSFGIFACFFANNVWFIHILWGGVVGFGMGLTISLLPQVININFKNDFSKANGISVVGVPLAGLLLSPMMEYFLKTYGLAGSFLILSAIIAHGVPVAMIIKIPRSRRTKETISKPKTAFNSLKKDLNNKIAFPQCGPKTISNEKIIYLDKSSSTKQRKLKDSIAVAVDIDTNNHEPSIYEEKALSNSSFKNEGFNNGLDTSKGTLLSENCENDTYISSEQSNYQTESLKKIDENMPFNMHHSRLKCPKSFQVFTNVSYLIIAFSQGSMIFLSFVYPTICTDFALDKGMSIVESTYLLMIIGGVDIVPRVTLGWITDRGYMTRANFCSMFFLLSTISILLTMWTNNFLTMAIVVSFQSFCIGALFPVVPGIIPKYVEKDQQTIAIASAPFFLVPLSVSTPALIGYFRDELGSYNALMYFFCLVSLSNSIFLFLLPHIDQWRRKYNN